MYQRGGDQQGRGSAAAAVLCLLSLLLLIINSDTTAVQAASVNYSIDWSFSPKVTPLANGKTYRAGDTLVFRYSPGSHNVVEVDKATYDKCGTPSHNNKVYASGADKVTLTKGQHYFICSFPGHCRAGMKIPIYAV